MMAPMKNTLGWPNLSPNRAPSNTVLPSTNRFKITIQATSPRSAPKLRAMEILREIEPVDRHWFTGSLFWFGDDGRLDSSILIRSWVFREGRGFLGAGGGIVADSVPEQEWDESNHKARVLAQALGFEPEEAG